MPCRDYYDDNPSAYYADTINGLKKQVSFAESALCQVLAAFEKHNTLDPKDDRVSMLDLIDYKEAGIKRQELEAWWVEHKRKDEASRAAAAEKKRVAAVKRAALAKLNAEERKALGIK